MAWWMKGLSLIVIVVWCAVLLMPDERLHVVFCDVGQGDAILIWKGTNQILIDGGPDDRVQDCLGRNLPFYDRRIEIVAMTHPQLDHLGGLDGVIESRQVGMFVGGPVGNPTQSYERLEKLLLDKDIKVVNPYDGQVIKMGEIWMTILWPERQFVAESSRSQEGVLGWTSEIDLNSYSMGAVVNWKEFEVLLTGDADLQVEDRILNSGVKDIEVLKVPHHGSKTGMSRRMMEMARPEVAVVSVGRGNSYGHPSEEILEMITSFGTRLYRTDVNQEVEVVSDGTKWWVVD